MLEENVIADTTTKQRILCPVMSPSARVIHYVSVCAWFRISDNLVQCGDKTIGLLVAT